MNLESKDYISVCHMPQYLFRNKLIDHFNILYKKDQIFGQEKQEQNEY